MFYQTIGWMDAQMFPYFMDFSWMWVHRSGKITRAVLIHTFIYLHNLHTCLKSTTKKYLTQVRWGPNETWLFLTPNHRVRKCAASLRREGIENVKKCWSEHQNVMPEWSFYFFYFTQSKLLHTLWFKAPAIAFPNFSLFTSLGSSKIPTSFRYFWMHGLSLTRRWNSYGCRCPSRVLNFMVSMRYCQYYK